MRPAALSPVTRYHRGMRTANPALNDTTFSRALTRAGYGESMTLDGTVTRTGVLLVCVLAAAAITWSQFFATRNPVAVAPYSLVGAIGGFITAMVTVFKKEW